MQFTKRAVVLFIVVVFLMQTLVAQSPDPSVYNDPPSRVRGMIERFDADYGILDRYYSAPMSANRSARLRAFYQERLAELNALDYDKLNHDEQIDVILFRNYLDHEVKEQLRFDAQVAEMATLVPFAKTISDLEDSRRKLEPVDPAKAAAMLNEMVNTIAAVQKNVDKEYRIGLHDILDIQVFRHPELNRRAKVNDSGQFELYRLKPIPVVGRTVAEVEKEIANSYKVSESKDTVVNVAVTGSRRRTLANRATRAVASLRDTLRRWYGYYNGYDPTFTWWCESPYKEADGALLKYQTFISTKLVGIAPDDKTTIIGDPIGREALIEELKFEMIPYSPEELVQIANKEFDWCIAEFKKASREMGFGDDYMKAIEAVKQNYVEPGKQPELIKKFAYEAIEYVEKNDLVTVPKLARDGWRMEMMSPERQLIAPFFLGGETILVAYPTDGMTHEQKMMSLRGNNPHFARAVTHHELIPGHHLQGFMAQRYRPYRRNFRTPFNTEGWALYWEFLLWDRGFVKTPEDKIGALFWRSHRAARIIFSLNFHLGNWTPEQCVDLLVNKVGHERDNAVAEVRRSFAGDYGPLYQMAYMMGGLQFQQLHRDLVGTKKMTDRAFHDAILKEGPIPIEMVRSIMTKQKLSRDFKTNWRYYSLP